MSSTGSYAAPGRLAAPATTSPLVAGVILGLFVLAALVSAQRKDVTQGFDEVAHASYVAHIQETGEVWPAFESMRLLDPQTFQFTGEANYLNHPPMFYALLAALGPKLVGRPQALLADRLIDVGLTALGFAALLWLGLAARFSRYEFYAYAVPLACIPVLAPLAGAVNNDDLAFLGGAIATLGVWRLAATPLPTLPRERGRENQVTRECGRLGRGIWLALALIGLVAAGWAKLTGLVLTAGMVGALLAYLFWRRRLPWSWAMLALFAFALAAAPYIVYTMQYGSPAPDTSAQIAVLESGARALGWADLPRRSFAAYAVYFVVAFVVQWMPALSARSPINDVMLGVPVAALVCALAGMALSLRRLRRRQETALDVAVIAGALSLAATLALHVRFSYGHYLATGWLMEAYPRYYLPLAAIVPLAGLSLLGAIEAPRWRAGLLTLLIAGPIVFRIFGAPLG